MLHIGFTGTRHGMTEPQKEAVRELLLRLCGNTKAELHHGDAVGSDSEAHDLFREACAEGRITVHPPANGSLRAFRSGAVVRPVKGYLARNRDIVAEADVVIATPAEAEEQQRGGTWYTIRAARKAGKNLFVVLPNGSVEQSSSEKEGQHATR